MLGLALMANVRPRLYGGTISVSCTVSIQKMADTCRACALGAVTAACPNKKAILSTPPPNGSTCGGGGGGGGGALEMMMTVVLVIVWPLIWLRSKLFGSSNKAC